MSSKLKRLVLFDIDGTILLGGPLWKDSFIGALNQHFPNLNFPPVSFNGKTDIQIFHETMFAAGYKPNESEHLLQVVVTDYIAHAKKLLKTRLDEVTVLPGIIDLIKSLHEHENTHLALLTGNVRKGAHMKLSCVGLDQYFDFEVSAFGDDNSDRYQLPPIAQEKAIHKIGRKFEGKEIVIIGDTVHDVNCGKSLGVRTIAVGTGRNVDQKELLSQNPDYYFSDFSGFLDVLDAILEDL